MRSICLGLLLIALADVVGACGGSGNSGTAGTSTGVVPSSANVQALDVAAGAKVKKVAARIVNATRDKNVPGPKTFKTVCLQAGESGGPDNPNTVRCTVSAYYVPYRGMPGGYLYVENWTVPILKGRLGSPRISGGYQIRDFLRQDNKKNCTGRHRIYYCLPQSQGGGLPG